METVRDKTVNVFSLSPKSGLVNKICKIFILALLHTYLVKHTTSILLEFASLVEISINSLVAYAPVKSPLEVVNRCPVQLPANMVLE